MDSRDPITSVTSHCCVCLQILHSHSTQYTWTGLVPLFINSEQTPEFPVHAFREEDWAGFMVCVSKDGFCSSLVL